MTISPTPWDLVPAFRRDRLISLARVLLDVREDAVQSLDRTKGDDSWVLGCMVHARLRWQLPRVAQQPGFEWLSATAPSNLQCHVKVAGAPLHVFRGDPQNPDARQVLRGHEKKQLALFEDPAAARDDGWANYLVVVTDCDGQALEVVFFQANEVGEVRHPWTVPVELPASTTVAPVVSMLQEGRDLPSPVVTPRVPGAGVSDNAAGRNA
jgi:hypothetical protein